MNISSVEYLIKSLGKHWDEISWEGVQVPRGLLELYEGDDVLAFVPEEGVEMSFKAENKVFRALNFRLKKVFPDDELYQGALPLPFKLVMSQDEMHTVLGKAVYSSGPIKMPEPMGQTGGWESFSLDAEKYPGAEVILQYTQSLDIFGLVFRVPDES